MGGLAANRGWIATAVVAAVATVWPAGDVAAAPPKTVVLMPERSPQVKQRYVRRTVRGLRKAAKRARRTAYSSAACPLDAACIAAAGAADRAARAVGVQLVKKRRDFELTFVAIDVATGAELLRSAHRVPRRKLRKAPAKLLRSFLKKLAKIEAPPAETQPPAETPPPADTPPPPAEPSAMTATAAAPPRADGRSAVVFDVSGAPDKRVGELSRRPEVPAASCDGAAPLAPVDGRAAVLAPVSPRQTALSCTIWFRDAQATLNVALAAAHPGLYATADPAWVLAGAGTARVTAIRIGTGGTSSVPDGLRAAASAGDVSVGRDGAIAIALPVDRKPRMIAIALADASGPGAAFLPVWGTTDLDVRADSRSSVRVRIAGRWFGPVVARRRRAVVPIEVPPGVRRAVVRATDRKGYALESSANLKTPDLPRLAAVAPSAEVAAGAESFLAVALAARDGRPAGDDAKVLAEAERGTVQSVTFETTGLWRIAYRAPAESGPDRITVRVDGDRRAGTADVRLNIGAGRATAIAIDAGAGPYRPGDRLEATATIRDALGNHLARPGAAATLGGAPARVEAAGDAVAITATIPDRLPERLVLAVTADGVTAEHVVATSALEPVTARVHGAPDGRTARVRVEVRDRLGNLANRDAFDVAIRGGRAGELARTGDRYEATVTAGAGARSAVVTVNAGGSSLTRGEIEFEPPAGTFLLGAYASGGWLDSGGAVRAARFGGGVGLRRAGERFELSLLLGAQRFAVDDRSVVDIGGMSGAVDRSIVAIEMPVVLRGRLRLSRTFGVSVGAGVVPTRATVEVRPDFQSADEYTELVIGARGQLAVDAQVGPGRVLLGAGYGAAQLDDGLVVGSLDGASAFAGYEWWFADLGP